MPKGLKDILQRVLFVETGTSRADNQPAPSRIGDIDFSFLTFDELVGQRAIDPDTTFQVLSLRSFKEAVAEEWDRHARTVGLAAENTISRRLRKNDTCVQESDDTFLFLFDVPSEEVATEKLHDITEALMRRLIGDRFAGVQAQVTQVDASEIMDAVGKLDEAALDRAVEAATVVTLSSAADGVRLVPMEVEEGRNRAEPKLVTDDPMDRAKLIAHEQHGDATEATWKSLSNRRQQDWDEIHPDPKSRLIKVGANDRPQFPKPGWEKLDRLDDRARMVKISAADDDRDGAAAAAAKRRRNGNPDWDEMPSLGNSPIPPGSVQQDGNARAKSAGAGDDSAWEEMPNTATPGSRQTLSDPVTGKSGQSGSDQGTDEEASDWEAEAHPPEAVQEWHAIDADKTAAPAAAESEGDEGDDGETHQAGRRKSNGKWQEMPGGSAKPNGARWPGHHGGIVPMEAATPTSRDRPTVETAWKTGQDRPQNEAEFHWPTTASKPTGTPAPPVSNGTHAPPPADWQPTADRPVDDATLRATSTSKEVAEYEWQGATADRPIPQHDVTSQTLPSKPDRDWGDPTTTRKETAGLVESDPLQRRPEVDWPTVIEVGTVVGHDLLVDHYDPGPPKAAPWQPLAWPPPDTSKRRRPRLPDTASTSGLPPGMVAGYWPVWNGTTRRVDTYMAVPMTIGEDGAPRVIRLGPASPEQARVTVDLAMLYATLDRIERNIDARQGWQMVVPLGFTTLMAPHFETAKLIIEHFPAAARGRYLLLEVGQWPQGAPRSAITKLRNVLPGLCRDVLLRIDGNGPPPEAIVELRASGLGLDLADFGRHRPPHLPRVGHGLRTYLWGIDDAESMAQVAKDGHWLVGGAGLGPPLSVPQPWQGPAWRPLEPAGKAAAAKSAAAPR